MGDVVESLYTELVKPIVSKAMELYGVSSEFNRLREVVDHVKPLLVEAGKRIIVDEALAKWLDDLESAVYDADDVVDEFLYECQRQTIECKHPPSLTPHGGATTARVRKRDKFMSFFHFLNPSQLGFRHRIGRKIDDARKALEDIARKNANFNTSALKDSNRGSNVERSIYRETSSLPHDDYIGRSSEKDQIMETLLGWDSMQHSGDSTDGHCNDLPVLPIVGLPGIGKTTLAQLIYNDERVKSFFKFRMWVCVSSDFDVKRIIGQILESVTEKKEPEVDNLDVIQNKLSKKLKGQRFLLVLDDVLNVSSHAWQIVRAPLIQGDKASRVVLTTRKGGVADTMGTIAPILLKGLSFDDCRQLLQKSASGHMNVEKSHVSQEICQKIVDRFNGAPLVVKTVGRILSSKVPRGWREILDGEIWESSGSEHSILPVLKLSYLDLPPHLKRCFAYCSLFPKRYEFVKSKLVKLWIAQGFIESKTERRYEDVGNAYFEELLSMSFFQKINSRYIMYDLFHDLTQHVSNQGCMRIDREDEKQALEKHCRHLSFSISKSKVIEDKLHGKMRSLIYVDQYIDDLLDSHLILSDDIFTRANCLRVLDLSGSKITQVPESVGDLIHLRFLDLSHTRIEVLPSTISKLYNLFSLELRECRNLKKITPAVLNLINLHYLSTTENLVAEIPGIGKLTSLQELGLFVVSVNEGHKISELQYMNQLHGRLTITDIQNVIDEKDAKQADLKKKIHLHELILKWSPNSMSNEHEDKVLDNLQPPPEIALLSIIGHRGSRSPSWMDNHSIYNVTSIHLRYCSFWKVLPPLGTLQHLISLKIEYLPSVEYVDSHRGGGVVFPCLENLVIRHMHGLKKWFETSKQTFPCLKKILIEDCPKLESFRLPSAIECLKIEKCPGFIAISNFILLGSLSMPSFSCSYENGFRSLKSCVEQTLQHLNSLERLEICFYNESVTDTKWAEKPSWMPYNFSQGRAADEVQKKDSGDIHIFLLYASNFPDYPDERRRDVCLRVKNLNAVEAHDYDSVSACLQEHIISLKQLSVKGCIKLSSLLGQGVLRHLEKLEKLEIEDSKELMKLEWFPQHFNFTCLRLLNIRACPDLIVFPRLKLIALEDLQIHYCDNLVSLDLQDLISLRRIDISDCPRLGSEMFACGPSSLRELRLCRCPQLTFPGKISGAGLEQLTFLECLEIRSCKYLKHLKTNLQVLSSLKKLSIVDCPVMQSLPETGLPPSLEELRIEGCPLLQERCQMGGADWHMVASIPKKIISCQRCHPFSCRCNT